MVNIMPLFRKKSDKQPVKPVSSSPVHAVHSAAIKRTPSSKSINSTGSQELINGEFDFPNRPTGQGARPKIALLEAESLPEAEGDLGTLNSTLDSPLRTSSRLSKTFLEILHDKDALAYFIQFMESKGVGPLIRFWLDADSFQASSWTRIRTHSLKSMSKSSVAQQKPQQSSGRLKEQPVLHGDGEKCLERPGLSLDIRDYNNDKIVQNNEHDGNECTKVENNNNSVSGVSKSFNSIHRNGIEMPSNTSEFMNSDPVEYSPQSPGSPCLSVSPSVNVADVLSKPDDHGRRKEEPSRDDILVKLKKSIERDAVNIYSKYISLGATHPIGISEELRNEAISKICREDGDVDPECFAACQQFVVDVMDSNFFNGFCQSEYHCKHQLDVLTSGQVYLADVLHNDAAMFYFMEYMEQEGAMNLLQFWMAAENFQQHLASRFGHYDPIEAQNDAMVFYDKYFSLQASHPLGFDDKIRFEVESNICREEGPLPDCFAKPRNVVLATINKIYFSPFIQSELYYKYLSELVNTIQMAHDMPHLQQKHKRAGSDASSEHSLGSHGLPSDKGKNTLLASADTGQFKQALNKIEDDLRIDSILLNPDALWIRQNAGPMSFGKMNELGQFISDFDPEPEREKKTGNRFFKKSREKQKEEEDMALRVAQMIINDVTAHTVTTPKNTESKKM